MYCVCNIGPNCVLTNLYCGTVYLCAVNNFTSLCLLFLIIGRTHPEGPVSVLWMSTKSPTEDLPWMHYSQHTIRAHPLHSLGKTPVQPALWRSRPWSGCQPGYSRSWGCRRCRRIGSHLRRNKCGECGKEEHKSVGCGNKLRPKEVVLEAILWWHPLPAGHGELVEATPSTCSIGLGQPTIQHWRIGPAYRIARSKSMVHKGMCGGLLLYLFSPQG